MKLAPCMCLALLFGFGAYSARADNYSTVPAAGNANPAEIVRALSQAQDLMLRDPNAALADQARLSRSLTDVARNGDASVWRSARNRRALVLYLLTGGDWEAVQAVARLFPVDAEEKTLVEGVTAFARGAEKEARAILLPIDPRNAAPELAGQIALTQGALLATTDPARAMTALDLARLLAPGALVEETALRRQIFLAAAGEDAHRFVALTERYRLRFSGTSFSDNFERKFREGFLKFWMDKDARGRATLESAILELPDEIQSRLYLDAARAGLARGVFENAAAAARKAKTLARAAGPVARQADLYVEAADILQFENGPEGAPPARAAQTGLEDRVLSEAIALLTEAWRQPAPALPRAPAGADSPIIAGAQEALSRAHDLLKRSR